MDLSRPRVVLAFLSGVGLLFGILVAALFLSGGPDGMRQSAAAAEAPTTTAGTTTTSTTTTAPATTSTTAQGDQVRVRAAVKVSASDYGPILFDGRGRALYAFTSDPSGESVCTGECAAAWPPYRARGRLRAGQGARQSLLGTATRRDGTLQVAYDGRPLYYYVGDREPGQVFCQDVVEFGGTWLVLRGDGRLVE